MFHDYAIPPTQARGSMRRQVYDGGQSDFL